MSSVAGRYGPIRLITGSSNRQLGEAVGAYLDVKCHCVTSTFSNGETRVDIPVSVRGCDVYVLQSTANPDPNNNNMELFIMLQAIQLSSPERITAVVPCMGYARQDRKSKSREPITAKLVAQLMCSAGAQHVIAVDLHADQIQGFFSVPVDHLSAENLFVHYIEQMFDTTPRMAGKPSNSDVVLREQRNLAKQGIVIVSPDAGGVKRARHVANKLGVGIAIISKQRSRANEVDSMQLIGDVRGQIAIVVDDMVDTAGTLCKAAQMLREEGGASNVIAMATHGILSGQAFERLSKSAHIDGLVVTDTVNVVETIEKRMKAQKDFDAKKIHVLSVGYLLGEAIRRSNNGQRLSDLFDKNRCAAVLGNLVVHNFEEK